MSAEKGMTTPELNELLHLHYISEKDRLDGPAVRRLLARVAGPDPGPGQVATPARLVLRTCDWRRISAHLPGGQWHPTHCGRMTSDDIEWMSDIARRIYDDLGLDIA